MPRQNLAHTDGSGHLIHATDVAAPDLYLAQLSRQTYLAEEYGAKMDGAADDTAAVQAALTAAGVTGGRVVVTNPCLCAGQLSVPPFVFLDCGQAGPQRGPYGQGSSPNVLGPSLLTTGNAGQTAASAAFLTLGRGSAFRGIIVHPNQTQTNPPIAYPPAIVLANGAEGAILKDVLLVNPYIGVWSAGHGKPYIDGLYGQPLNIGLYLDQCYDIARIKNVHWWNFWKTYVSTDPLETYQRQHLIAFDINRVDGLHAENWLVYGAYIGVNLGQVANGPGSGAINKLWVDGGVHGVAASAVGYQGMTIRDSVIYSQYKDGSGNPGYSVVITGNATALDRLTFDGFDLNQNVSNNPSAVLVGSGVTGGRYRFQGGAFESYSAAAIVCQSAAASLSVRGTSFRGSGGTVLDVSTLTSSATGVYEVADCEFAATPAYSLGASTPPGLSLGRNRLYERGVYRVGGYGAKGDGSTDDRAAIQAAITACGAAGGGVVQLDNRTYTIAAPLTITQSGVRLVGSSRRGTKINNTSLTTDALQIGAAGLPSHIAVEHLEISGTLAGRTAGNAITMTNCGTGCRLHDLVLDNHVDGLAIGAAVYEVYAGESVISSCTGSFLHIDPGSGTAAPDVDLDRIFCGSPSGGSAVGLNVAAVSGLYASKLNITGAFQYAGLFRPTVSGQQIDWAELHSCYFDAATASCFLIDSTPGFGSVNSAVFTACWFASGGTNGMEVNLNTAGFTLDMLDLIGCRFYHNGHEGLHAYGSLAAGKSIYLTDCHAAANSQSASGTYNGLLFDGNIGGFHVRGGHSGLEASGAGYTSTQNYGLVVSAGSGNHWDVEGLNCRDNTNAAGIFIGAQSNTDWSVKNCPPYSPRGVQGPPAVPASGTALTNPYGADAMVYLAGGTVSAVSVGGAATGLTSTPASVRVPAKSSITLTYSVAPAWVWALD